MTINAELSTFQCMLLASLLEERLRGQSGPATFTVVPNGLDPTNTLECMIIAAVPRKEHQYYVHIMPHAASLGSEHAGIDERFEHIDYASDIEMLEDVLKQLIEDRVINQDH